MPLIIVLISLALSTIPPPLSVVPQNENQKIDLALALSKRFADSNYSKSAQYASEALSLSRNQKNPTRTADACLLLAKARMNQQDLLQSIALLKEAQQLYTLVGNTEGIITSKLILSSVYVKAGDMNLAMKSSEVALDLCLESYRHKKRGKKLNELTYSALANLVKYSVRTGQSRKTIATFQKHLNVYKSGPEELSMNLRGLMAELYRSLGSYDTAIYLANISREQGLKISDKAYLAKVSGLLSNISSNQGRYADALKYEKENLRYLKESGNLKDLPMVYNNIGTIYKNTNDLSLAVYYYLESLRLKEKVNDSAGIAMTLGNLGLVYKSWGKKAEALSAFHRAALMNVALRNNRSLSIIFNNLGEYHFENQSADSALFYFNRAFELKKKLSDTYGIIVSLDGIGRTYHKLKNEPAKALPYFLQADKLARETKTDYWIANLEIHLGELYIELSNPGKARSLLMGGLEYAYREKLYDLIQSATRLLVELSINRGDKIFATNYFNAYLMASDSIVNREKQKTALELLTRFETEKKEKENLILRKENDIQHLKINHKNLQLFGLMIIIILLTVSGFIIFWFYRQKDKAYRLLVRNNVEFVKAGNFEKPTVSPILKEENTHSPRIEKVLVITPDQELIEKLLAYVEGEKIYLNTDLSLDDICRHINTNRTYLSNLINDHFRKNFHLFINDYRVVEARKLLIDQKNDKYTIEQIGKMAGFGTKASFHSNFKSVIGVTPAYFRQHANIIN